MNVFLFGKTVDGQRTAVAVSANGSLLMKDQNEHPDFINFPATTVATALPDKPGIWLSILNNTGVDVVVDHGVGSETYSLPTGNERRFALVKSSNELRVKVAAGEHNLSMEIAG